MRAEKFLVRVATEADLAEVVALERGITEASHWTAAEYAGIVLEGSLEGAVRRCFFVAEADASLLGFAVGKVIGLGRTILPAFNPARDPTTTLSPSFKSPDRISTIRALSIPR